MRKIISCPGFNGYEYNGVRYNFGMRKGKDEQQTTVQASGKVYNRSTIPEKSVPVLYLLTCISPGGVSSDLLESVLYVLHTCKAQAF